jgi:hypothetical protein
MRLRRDADSSGIVRIWDTTQKEHLCKLELKVRMSCISIIPSHPLKVLSGPISDLQWSDDSKRIVVVGDGKEKFGAVSATPSISSSSS